MAGDCDDGLSRIPSPFPVLQSSNRFGEDRGARAEGMSFVCIFSTLCRVETYISFLIFQIYAAPSTLLWTDGGWRRAAGSAMCVVGWSVGIPFKKGTIDHTFSLILILIFVFSCSQKPQSPPYALNQLSKASDIPRLDANSLHHRPYRTIAFLTTR